MKIANIVSISPVDVDSNFNVVPSMDSIIPNLPTLIVGFYKADIISPNFDVSDYKLKDNLYWTCMKTEKRDIYVDGLHYFVDKIYEGLVSNIKYVYVDPIHYEFRKIKKILRKIHSINKSVAYMDKDRLYIYGESIIFGMDLRMLEYVGISKARLKDMVSKVVSIFLEGNEILVEYKEFMVKLNSSVMYIPYLYYLDKLSSS